MNRLSQYHTSPLSPPALPRKGILVTGSQASSTGNSYHGGPQSLPWGGISGSRSEFNSVTFKKNNFVWENQKLPRVDPWRKEESDSNSSARGDSASKQFEDRRIYRVMEDVDQEARGSWHAEDETSRRQAVGGSDSSDSGRRSLAEDRKAGVRSTLWYNALNEDQSTKTMKPKGKTSENITSNMKIRRLQRSQGEESSCSGRLASLSIADMSPKLALQRILNLYQRSQYREAAAFLRRLSLSTFKQLVSQLPTDHFVEKMPQSLPILEALYSKLFLAGGKPLWTSCQVSPETVVWQLVKFFASQEDQSLVSREGRWEFCGPFINTCKRLLSVLITTDPNIRKIVAERKKVLTRTIEGLGQHGMVGTSDKALMNLHDALRIEFQKVKEQISCAMNKLDQLALSGKEPITNSAGGGKAPILSSHQRQLSLHLSQVQERLIKNKTLLTTAEPAVNATSLEVLLGILQRRIELDKEVLFQFTSIKRGTSLVGPGDRNPAIAPVLMKFQRGCHQVLELMREVTEDEKEEEVTSDISGYHSDSDSAIMMSGNSPFISKNARCNFLLRSVRQGGKSSKGSDEPGYVSSSSGFSSLPPSSASASSPSVSPPSSTSSQQDSDSSEGDHKNENKRSGSRGKPKKPSGLCGKCTGDFDELALKKEIESLREQLASTRETLLRMHEREEKVKQRLLDLHLNEEQISISSTGSHVYLSTWPHASRLVASYGELYSRDRLVALDNLDKLTELSAAPELKNKILFSVVVLSFRSVSNHVQSLKQMVRRTLQIPSSPGGDTSSEAAEFNASLEKYLASSSNLFNHTPLCQDVMNQICSTLFDYPSIRNCFSLSQYIRSCVKLAWSLYTHRPAYTIEYEEREYQPDMMLRAGHSNEASNRVATYLWPALKEGNDGAVVYKAVVVT